MELGVGYADNVLSEYQEFVFLQPIEIKTWLDPV